MQKTKLALSALFSISLIYLATSIVFFTLELGTLNKELPEILQSVENIENKTDVEAILKTANRAIGEIPNILEETKNVRKEIKEIRIILPNIVNQVDGINKNIPLIIGESKEIRKSIPPILKESEGIRKDLPSVLTESPR